MTIDAEKLKATDEQIIEWAERHGILNGITDLMGLRCAFDDARTLLNSEPAGGDGLVPASEVDRLVKRLNFIAAASWVWIIEL